MSQSIETELTEEDNQQHPISMYLKIWLLLFVLSALSYLVDYLQFQGVLRWSLILIFMALKSGLIIAVFMHMMWERMALITAILIPPLCLLMLIVLMLMESQYTFLSRVIFFSST
jgi:cytochrome c oxidase subunit 4